MGYKKFKKLSTENKFKYMYLDNLVLALMSTMLMFGMIVLHTNNIFVMGFFSALIWITVFIFYFLIFKQMKISKAGGK